MIYYIITVCFHAYFCHSHGRMPPGRRPAACPRNDEKWIIYATTPVRERQFSEYVADRKHCRYRSGDKEWLRPDPILF